VRLRELLFPSSSRWNFRRCNRRARRRRPWIDCGRGGAAPSGSDGATMRGDERGEEVADVNALGEDEVVAVDT